jgi:hypothetical protein
VGEFEEEWLLKYVAFFRTLGFFEKYASMSDAQLAALLQTWYVAAWERELEPGDRLTDLRLASADETRVWWNDLIAGVGKDNNVYVRTLGELSKISRGHFSPDEIQEMWDAERGPIAVAFLHKDEKVRVYPLYLGEDIDLSILDPINRMIAESGVELYVYRRFDDTAFIVALTPEEKLQLVEERGWEFEN